MPPGLFSRAYSQNIEVLSSAEGNNGFQYTMDEDYIDITAYSDLYRSHDKNQPLLIPMKIDNKIVAIAGKKSEDPHLTSYGIIDPQGNTLSGFDFKHNRIIPIKVTVIPKMYGFWYSSRKITIMHIVTSTTKDTTA
ncbi:hypothetical protein QW060_25400 [Myroides ceti]|uniref:Uncharacterized protein n=1 Tax=Paenimyroides ceti TaxID=395087 RepID=A0ABT8D087_9FLAO|nr:hypothetical protein [Paenimyroides ceti]MDN3710209.1 hypothetical protein [Paenimyroides ceti]